MVCSVRYDTALSDLSASTAGRRGRSPKYGKRLTMDEIVDNLTNCRYRMDDYFVVHLLEKMPIIGDRAIHA